MRLQIKQLALFVLITSCYSTPADISACVGSDVNIPWEYPDSAGMSSVSWEHIDSSNVKTTILVHFAGSNPTVANGYNIQHNTNGDVTITSATVANSGTYRITVGYSTATIPFTDDVVVNVNDPPTGFSFTGTPSGSQTTFTCAATSLGDPAADLYIQVNGVNQTSSVSATVPKTDTVKCFLSGPSVQCMSEVSGTVTSLCAQCPPTVEIYNCPGLGNSTAVDSEGKCVCAWIGISFGILLVVLFLIGICCGCILICECCYERIMEDESCNDCASHNCCKCKCFDSTPCRVCCNIKRLPSCYQVLWATIIGIPVAFGIWLVWSTSEKANEPGRNDSTNNSSGDVPLNTKYSN